MSKRPTRSLRRRGVVAAGVAAFAGLFVVATAVPAFAHTAALSGSSVCSDGAHVITWTIESLDTPLPMHVASATATLDGSQTFPVSGAVGNDIPENTSITATTTVPGNLTGTVVLAVHGTWTDGATADSSTSVPLTSQCTTGDTTTTSTTVDTSTSTTGPTTSTTVDTSTSTTGPTTSTTVESSTTVPSSTTTPSTPVTGEGSTAASTTTTAGTGSLGSTTSAPASGVTAAGNPTGSGNLPFTGSTDSGPIVGLTSLVGGAFALVFARRRRSNR